jgi:hypothetical protein
VILRNIQGLLLAGTLLLPLSVQAVTKSEVINGATCIPYPPYGQSLGHTGIAYQHWLYGISAQQLYGTAYCQLTMSSDWTVNNLSYVLFTGSVSGGGVLSARLCVHSGEFAVTCGYSSTISPGGFPVNWVAPPSPMPPYASGAFVQFTFPGGGQVSTIRQLIPVWSK